MNLQNAANPVQIDCQACRTSGSMVAAKIPRFSEIVRLIGFIFLVPSFLGLGVTSLMILSAVFGGTNSPPTSSDAEVAGRAIGYTIVGGFILIVGAVSLISGLLGWLLIMTRKVFKCLRCGFVMERG